MILTTRMLEEQLSSYENPRNKIGRMVASGELVTIRRGLYTTNRTIPGHCLAPLIFGPSYLSFEYALAHHGLIPEAVHSYTSATCGKRKTKHYENDFGRYDYRDVPIAVFPLSVSLAHEGDLAYWIASPEKALCDQLHKTPPAKNFLELEELLMDDLRIDEDALLSLNARAISLIAQRYHCRNVTRLSRYLERTAR